MTSEYILRMLIRSYRFNRYDCTLIHEGQKGATGPARVMIVEMKSGKAVYGWKNDPATKRRTRLYYITDQRLIDAVFAFNAMEELSQ